MSAPAVEGAKELRVVTVGEALIRFAPPPFERFEFAQDCKIHIGGSEANVAAGLAGLGVEAVWISKIPDTFVGDLVLRRLRAHGVNTSQVLLSDTKRMGSYYTNPLSEEGGFEVVYDRADSAFLGLRIADIDLSVLDGADALHLTGITTALGAAARELQIAMAQEAKRQGIPVTVDVNFRRMLWTESEAAEHLQHLLPLATVLISTLEDAREVFRCPNDAHEAAYALQQRFGSQVVALTLGERGCIAIDGSNVVERDAIASRHVDRMGRGDAFCAGFLFGWLSDGLAMAADYGVVAASIAQSTAGDLPLLSGKEVTRVLHNRAHITYR